MTRFMEHQYESAKPESSRRLEICMPFLVLGLFALYAITTCPTVYPGDSGELIAAAFSLGIPHNSGYPLYSILGKAASFVPLGAVGYRLNLFSSLAVVSAIALLSFVVLKWTLSRIISISVVLFLAFTPKVWTQSASAEVYGLHLFFVVLIVWLLIRWDREQRWWWLALLAFAAGLSFGNHLQTVMLGPAVLLVILAKDKGALIRPTNLLLLTLLFCLPLALYAYLPIRTGAGAAITWGDPDTWDRFLAHVTATSHRQGYVFNQTLPEYAGRAGQAFAEIWRTFGPLLFLAFWGWWRIREMRWKCFFLLVIMFDLIYAVFLNTVSLEITPFCLPTCIALTVLIGVGITRFGSLVKNLASKGVAMDRVVLGGLCILPVIPLVSNMDRCDQSRNYTAYEHAVNMFRTLEFGDAMVMAGDNHVFPAAYGRIVEGMGEHVRLYDRHNIIFKLPGVQGKKSRQSDDWEAGRNKAELYILASRRRDVFYAVFSAHGVTLPAGYNLTPAGVLHKAVPKHHEKTGSRSLDPWPYYARAGIQDPFYRDYMTREICAFYYFSKGKHLFNSGRPAKGLAYFQLASRIGYDDELIHSEMGVFLTNQGLYEAARKELEIASVHHESLHVVHNNWGYYYHNIGQYDKAAASFKRALALRPHNVGDHNNLGFALYESGKEAEALEVLRKSLALEPDQPAIQRFIRKRLER